MPQHVFRDPRTIRRLHEGPLGGHIDALAEPVNNFETLTVGI